MYFTYILQSLKDHRYYYGSTSNLEERLKTHNAGKVRSTKSRRPLKIIYYETFDRRSEAYRRELFFKSKEGYEWLKKEGIIH
ncbi:GIY-YIG nuclease family protein [Melioribacter sp. Ez-97]|uniref:GIY-YIG nuclease family protein n=1 Tax=Melioribacter sp. Ez-97 TaxID=3423434 RepID=UPI003EDB0198